MTTPQDRYRTYLETLTPATLASLEEYVAADVHFRDPFNDVVGIDGLYGVFAHMFENIQEVNFRVEHEAIGDDVTLWHWTLCGVLRGQPWKAEGASTLRFNAEGLVSAHLDHWDAAQNFYETLPVIGWVLRRIRSRLARR